MLGYGIKPPKWGLYGVNPVRLVKLQRLPDGFNPLNLVSWIQDGQQKNGVK